MSYYFSSKRTSVVFSGLCFVMNEKEVSLKRGHQPTCQGNHGASDDLVFHQCVVFLQFLNRLDGLFHRRFQAR